MTPIDPATLRIAPLTRAHAEDLATWAYDAPYDVYDMAGAEPDELLDPAAGFHAVLAGAPDGRGTRLRARRVVRGLP